jgi:hypothetical protein
MRFVIVTVLIAASAGGGCSSKRPPTERVTLESLVAEHPAGEALARIFSVTPLPTPADFLPTGLKREDYLALIADNVDFWKQHQDAAGAIIDPFEHQEKQYSTPAFALASAILVAEAGRDDLLDASARAMTFAAAALANKTAADNHADFYIPMLMHARRMLTGRVPTNVSREWDRQLRSIVPQKNYRDIDGVGNWNLVHVSGECLRRKDGLVPMMQRGAQATYIDEMLRLQQSQFTRFGMYADASAPLAYDAFPRMWLEDMTAEGAYRGPNAAWIERSLDKGALSSLLLLSPAGEWASGGRSAHHQWNEAQIAAICEINAVKWNRRGRADIAGAFKRAAHLALGSIKRWQRPSGELWIVKNRAEPRTRFGFEGYGFHSQYNLLPMAMLALAYIHADDSIAERPAPSEIGGYVFDLRETFHKICAAAGGTYVLIDTSADPHYNATGLQRVHKAGVALSPLSDSAAGGRSYGPGDAPKAAMAPGIQWKFAGEENWRSLAELKANAQLRVSEESPQRVQFSVAYEPQGAGALPVREDYLVTADGVEGTTQVSSNGSAIAARVVFPALVNDGANDTQVKLETNHLSIRRDGGELDWQIIEPAGLTLKFEGPRIPTHNGYVQAAVADLPANTWEVKWRLTLQP